MQKSVLLSKHLWLSGQVHLWLCSLNSMAWRSSGTHGASFPGRSSHTVCLSSVASWCSMMLHDVPSHPFTKSSKRPAANPSAASLVGCRPRIVNPKYISKGTYLLKENPCEDSLLHHSSFLGALGIDHFTRLFPAWKSVDLKQPARDKGPDPFQIHPIHFLIQIHPNNVSQRIGPWSLPSWAHGREGGDVVHVLQLRWACCFRCRNVDGCVSIYICVCIYIYISLWFYARMKSSSQPRAGMQQKGGAQKLSNTGFWFCSDKIHHFDFTLACAK